MRKIGLILGLVLAATAAHAQLFAGPNSVAVYCTNTPTTKYTNGPLSNTISSEVSPTANGRSNTSTTGTNVTVCAVPATKPSTWYLRISNDGGTTYGFVTLGSVGFGIGGIPTPPPVGAASAVITWSAPTTDTTGKPLTVPLTYNIYRGPTAANLTKLTNVTGLTYTDQAGSATPTTYFYAITAICAGCTESAESAVVSATLQAAAIKPTPPGNVATH